MDQQAGIPDKERGPAHVDIMIHKSWIDQWLRKNNISFPLNEQLTLHHIRIGLAPGELHFEADIREKEGSSLIVTIKPVWLPELQQLLIDDLQIHTTGKNFLLKSAGWFAQHFLNAKIDKKMEQKINEKLLGQLHRIKQHPFKIKIPAGGNAEIDLRSLHIYSLELMTDAVRVIGSIDALWKIQLIAMAKAED